MPISIGREAQVKSIDEGGGFDERERALHEHEIALGAEPSAFSTPPRFLVGRDPRLLLLQLLRSSSGLGDHLS